MCVCVYLRVIALDVVVVRGYVFVVPVLIRFLDLVHDLLGEFFWGYVGHRAGRFFIFFNDVPDFFRHLVGCHLGLIKVIVA